MSRESQTSSSSSSGMTKPNCTIRERQDELLDELAEGRYASRSEALRTAIEQLSQTVNDDDDSVYERILNRISKLISEIEEIREKLEDIEDHSQVRPGQPNQALDNQSEAPSNPVNSTSTDRSSEVEKSVYQALLEDWPQTIPELAECVDAGELDVRDALGNLRDRGFVAQASDETEQLAYNPTGFNGE